jgi:hypothetical protein
MGMYSTIYNTSHAFGPQFLGELQTKDLDCVMDEYWLSPNGELYHIDTVETHEPQINPDSKNWVDCLMWVPTGRHGSIRPCLVTNVLRMYGSPTGKFVETFAYFRDGRLVEVLPNLPARF